MSSLLAILLAVLGLVFRVWGLTQVVVHAGPGMWVRPEVVAVPTRVVTAALAVDARAEVLLRAFAAIVHVCLLVSVG